MNACTNDPSSTRKYSIYSNDSAYWILVTADIEKAFLMVSIAEQLAVSLG